MIHRHTIDMREVFGLTEELLRHVGGRRKVVVEQALLAGYCHVADGVQAYPEATRSARAHLVLRLGAEALCRIIEDVGAMPDEAVQVATETRTCRPS